MHRCKDSSASGYDVRNPCRVLLIGPPRATSSNSERLAPEAFLFWTARQKGLPDTQGKRNKCMCCRGSQLRQLKGTLSRLDGPLHQTLAAGFTLRLSSPVVSCIA